MPVKDVACPKCKAAVGSNCLSSGRSFCESRITAFRSQNIVKAREVGNTARILRSPEEKTRRYGSNPTAVCRVEKHSDCSGFHAPKHGMKLQCTCKCHRCGGKR